jgi:RimJ/RimL family protein N-acetyltransferase
MPIRLLTPDDTEPFIALRREMLDEAPSAFAASPRNDRALDPAAVRAGLAASVQGTPGYAIIGALDGPRLVGSVGLALGPHDKLNHRAQNWGVYVTPSHRRAGLAQSMLELAIATARAWPAIDSVRLSASIRSVQARRLYERLGFVPWGIEPRAMSLNGEQIDEVHMVKFL